MKLQVNVTQKHIDKGQRNSYYCKPIELAMINSGVYTAFVREDAQIAFKYQGIMYYRDQPEYNITAFRQLSFFETAMPKHLAYLI